MKLYLRYIALIIGLEIIMIVFFDFEKWVTILISVTIGMGLYFSHLLMLEINRVRLINNKCDPESYIQMTIEMKKSKFPSVPAAIRDLELAGAYGALGDFDQSKEMLLSIDTNPYKKSITIMGLYYNYLASAYLYLGDLEESERIFNEHTRPLNFKRKILIVGSKLTEAEFLFYKKEYQAAKKLINEVLDTLKVNSLRIECIYFLAQIDEVEGYNEEALLKYQKVAEEGNKLWFAKKAKEIILSRQQSL